MTIADSINGLMGKLGYQLVANERSQALEQAEVEVRQLKALNEVLQRRGAAQPDGAEPQVSYRYYGQFMPPVDQFIHERYFGSSLLKGRFLECGGAEGVGESCCLFFEETLGWTGINIEASPPLFERLEKNRPNALNIHAALSDTDGVVEFTHAHHPTLEVFGNGSVAHSAPHRAELDSLGCTYEKFSVPCLTYRTLISQYGIDRLDLMVLDVEGYEETALLGMVGAPVLPTIMCVEFGHTGSEKIRGLLHDMGYAFDITSHGNAFYVRQEELATLRRFRPA